ncbi:MAG: hypothetical protein OXI05_04125 [Bacteroidota bacterium]|nr:hypothetical protein [Bacteroidota bacterium]MXW13354.1 hypothetical protein [Rhodothermaceae bacterium]MDE2645013.1 hypothetical protein [Bacteroidota bacterium]MXW32475.1 hypothetical protein [Rhodothermaceae bacterium]MXZ18462.1 hypothetical protein [Rhodothermaceae bacterium]
MRLIVLILLTTLGASCQTSHVPDTNTETIDTEKMGNQIRGTGKIVWNNFEGGFFGIVDQAGTRYYPLNPLNEELRIDGTAVRYVLSLKPDVMTTVMWGMPVSVISIEKINR